MFCSYHISNVNCDIVKGNYDADTGPETKFRFMATFDLWQQHTRTSLDTVL